MAQYDGYVRIKTDIDDAAALKKLDGLASKLNKVLSAVQAQSGKLDTLTASYSRLAEAGEQFAEGWQNGASNEFLDSLIAQLDEELKALGLTKAEIEGFNTEIVSGTAPQDTAAMTKVRDMIAAAKDKMDELRASVENTRKAFEAQSKESENLPKSADALTKFNQRIGKMAKTALVFYGFRRLFAGIRNGLMSLSGLSAIGDVFSQFNASMTKALEKNPQFQSALAQLKGALYSAFTPIMTYIVPAISALCGWIARAIVYIGAFFSALSGKSMKDNIQDAEGLAKGIGDVGGAAKDANKQLAAFDKLNNLNESTGGGGGGGGTANIAPDFDFGDEDQFAKAEEFGEKVKEVVDKIKGHIQELEANASVALGAIGITALLSGHIGLGIGALIGAGILNNNIVTDWDSLPEEMQKRVTQALAITSASAMAIGLVLLIAGTTGMKAKGLGLLLAGGIGAGTAVKLNWDSIVDKVRDVKDKLEKDWAGIVENWDYYRGKLSQGIENVKLKFQSFKTKVEGVFDRIRELFSKEWTFPSIKLPHITWSETPVSSNFAKILGITAIPKIQVEWYADGGFPDVGSMFIAGEAGPELVGSFGSHNNSVINEAQLVQAFQVATSAQTELLQQQNALLQAILEASGTVTFSPSASAGKVFSQSISMYNRAMG